MSDDEKHSSKKEFNLRDCYFREYNSDAELFARFRHRGEIYKASLISDNSNYKVNFEEELNIAVGQSVVFYSSQGECIGGGVVKV